MANDGIDFMVWHGNANYNDDSNDFCHIYKIVKTLQR